MKKLRNLWALGVCLFIIGGCSGERFTELMNASRDGQNAAVQRALDNGAEVDNRTKKGKTALMLAASEGHTDTVKLLIDHGADPRSQDYFGTTALIVAATADKKDTAVFLAKQGADPTHKDSSGGSALSNAVFFGHTGTVEALLDFADKLDSQDAEELLMVASGLGHTELTKVLLQFGVSPNARGVKQRTALMAAVAFNKIDTTKLLLKKGANPYLTDEDGYSAFDVAKDKDHEKILALLKSHPFDKMGK